MAMSSQEDPLPSDLHIHQLPWACSLQKLKDNLTVAQAGQELMKASQGAVSLVTVTNSFRLKERRQLVPADKHTAMALSEDQPYLFLNHRLQG